ncbi:MAG: MerR family transcriptional regulator [Eubacteriales bacterium]|nr:MerR family transcriptional regulator [Eubacteriales bacterium]MDD4327021.1 MerR family transcriptional regulator [Eubacteriales bacterium]MDD4716575.1 MerR family transcriptional regulator [Eubacteriales bacterium]
MEYSINKLARIAGITTRTLRYYDEIGLLKPGRISSNGYRVYASEQVDLLQQILFYRELGVPLEEISAIVSAEDFDRLSSLEGHLTELINKRERLDILISNVEKTILASKGEIRMKDTEKFEGFKQKLLEENEEKFGKEVRAKYGEETVKESNRKLMGMSQEVFDKTQQLSEELASVLRIASSEGDPTGELAFKVYTLHKEWLCFYWPSYSSEGHIGLAQTYTSDERFAKYYEAIAPGSVEFLCDAIRKHAK